MKHKNFLDKCVFGDDNIGYDEKNRFCNDSYDFVIALIIRKDDSSEKIFVQNKGRMLTIEVKKQENVQDQTK